MSEPRRDLNEILFAQDAGDGMKIVASTLGRSENGGVLRAHWKGKLAPYYRLKYDPDVPFPPEEAFTYVALGGGDAAVLKRVRGASTAGRNFSHALVGARELLDELALPLTRWNGWYDEQDTHIDPLKDRDVDELRTRVRSYQDKLHKAIEKVPRDKVIGLVARVLSEPGARFTVVGIESPYAPTVLALVRYIVTDLAGMTRGWTFSTFEAHREPRHLPDFVFMPFNLGALEDSGGARTVVDLTAVSADLDDEDLATTLVDLYLQARGPDARHLERTLLLTQLKRKVHGLPKGHSLSDGHVDQSIDRGRHHADDDAPDMSDVDGCESGPPSPEELPDTEPDPRVSYHSRLGVAEMPEPEPEIPDPDPGRASAPLPVADATTEDMELATYPETATVAGRIETALEHQQMDLAHEEDLRWHEAQVIKAEERRRKAVARELAAHQEEERRAMNRRQAETPSSGTFPKFVISDQETLIQALNQAGTCDEMAQILIQARGLYISPAVRGHVWHALTNGKLRATLNEPDEVRKQLVMGTILDLLVGRLEVVGYPLVPEMMIDWLESKVGQHFGEDVRKRAVALSPPPQKVQGGTVVPLVWVIVAVGVTFVFAFMIAAVLGVW